MSKRVSDLTVEEFRLLLREEIKAALLEVREGLRPSPTATIDNIEAGSHGPLQIQRLPLDIPILDVGPWPKNLSLRREDIYGDDGR